MADIFIKMCVCCFFFFLLSPLASKGNLDVIYDINRALEQQRPWQADVETFLVLFGRSYTGRARACVCMFL